MPKPLILLSIPALREKDVAVMPKLRELMAGGGIAELTPTFPCVTCSVQANMTTGRGPGEHGIVANGFYRRERRQVEMWTAPNDCVEQPQIWDLLSHHGRGLTSAVWFPMHSRGCEADYICTPAPIHNPDGSESLWCYTRPTELYGTLRDRLGHFPLMNYWGPMTNVKASAWIAESAAIAAREWQPDFFYIYLPHLDYAAQRNGPDSSAADLAIAELDEVIGKLADDMTGAYDEELLWIVAGEYAITPVDHVSYPNRVLREAGLLTVRGCEKRGTGSVPTRTNRVEMASGEVPVPLFSQPLREADDGECLDFEQSRAFALVDHQFSHVFVANGDERVAARVADLFRGQPDIAEVLVGTQRGRYGLEHARSGEVILISTPRSWQAYYWWLSDDRAPKFARTVDIHRKPGYDPVELCSDPATKSIPLDATRIKGSHGVPAVDHAQLSVLLASEPTLFSGPTAKDTDVFGMVLKHFGLR